MTRATLGTDEAHPKPSVVVFLRPELPREDELVVGRSRSCDLVIDDASVSRQHARIGLQGTPWVEDLGSRQGTWVRGQRLAPGERRTVEPGEPVRLGQAVILVQPGGPSVVPHRLTVGADGTWCSIDDGQPITFVRRKLLARLLLTLVDAHANTPGVPVSNAELQRVGWPGETVSAHHASNRLYVAIARLRGLGLAPVIQTLDQGYLIPPTVVIQRAAPAARP